MSGAPRIEFSRLDPSRIVTKARSVRGRGGPVRILALGGQRRDRIFLGQLLANEFDTDFLTINLAMVPGESPAEEITRLKQAFEFAGRSGLTLFFDEADALFGKRSDVSDAHDRYADTGKALRELLDHFSGTVVLGMPEQVEPRFDRLPSIDLQVDYRASMLAEETKQPRRLPRAASLSLPLSNRNFRVYVDGEEIGFCELGCMELAGGILSGFPFEHPRSVDELAAIKAEELGQWPVLTLRRGITQDRSLYQWRRAIHERKQDFRDVVIEQLDTVGDQVVNTWLLANCWPRRWRGPGFDALSNGPGYEQVELYYLDVIWR